MFAVAVAGQAVIVAVLGAAAVQWVLPTNIAAFLFNGYDYYDGNESCVQVGDGAIECGGGMAHLSLAFGATLPRRAAGGRDRPVHVVVPASRRALTARGGRRRTCSGTRPPELGGPGPGVEWPA